MNNIIRKVNGVKVEVKLMIGTLVSEEDYVRFINVVDNELCRIIRMYKNKQTSAIAAGERLVRLANILKWDLVKQTQNKMLAFGYTPKNKNVFQQHCYTK